MKLVPFPKLHLELLPLTQDRFLDIVVCHDSHEKSDLCIDEIIPSSLLPPNCNHLVVSVLLAVKTAIRPLIKKVMFLRDFLVALNKLVAKGQFLESFSALEYFINTRKF